MACLFTDLILNKKNILSLKTLYVNYESELGSLVLIYITVTVS